MEFGLQNCCGQIRHCNWENQKSLTSIGQLPIKIINKFGIKSLQTELAGLVRLSYVQVGRYETNKSNPSANVLNRLAAAIDTSINYLMKGAQREAVAAQLTDMELLIQFKLVELLNQEDKHLIKTFIDAYITKRQNEELAS